jgi:hypothetical protein
MRAHMHSHTSMCFVCCYNSQSRSSPTRPPSFCRLLIFALSTCKTYYPTLAHYQFSHFNLNRTLTLVVNLTASFLPLPVCDGMFLNRK